MHAISVWKSNREVKAETAGGDEKGRVKMERGKKRGEKWVNNWRPPERVCTQLSADSPLGPQVASSLRYCQLERGATGGRKAGEGEMESGREWWGEQWQWWGREERERKGEFGRKRCSRRVTENGRDKKRRCGGRCRQMRYKGGDGIYGVKKCWWFVFWCFGNCLSTSLLPNTCWFSLKWQEGEL